MTNVVTRFASSPLNGNGKPFVTFFSDSGFIATLESPSADLMQQLQSAFANSWPTVVETDGQGNVQSVQIATSTG